MKEMVGGCCVCSDERGWPDNPLVYCDGNGCTVAVHQACYGIVTVPTGPWFCRKCENPDTKGKVRCELCPSKSGALKLSDTGGWAHVVCALYIPEVRFGNVTSMEPIVLRLIPQERYNKTCYICQEQGKSRRANAGACMQCNKAGCKQQFHVTCAQSLGLLCEEAGNYLDNVKYCGYCKPHYSKLKKTGNVKTIPPYKPVSHDSQSSDSSGDKDGDASPLVSAGGITPHALKQKSSTGRKSSHSNTSSSGKYIPSGSKTPTSNNQPLNTSQRQSQEDSRKINNSGSKLAVSPRDVSENLHISKAATISTSGVSSLTTSPLPSPGEAKNQETVGVISSISSVTTSATPTVNTYTPTSVVQTTNSAKQSLTYQESVITNTEALDNKQTKKRKAVTAAASATLTDTSSTPPPSSATAAEGNLENSNSVTTDSQMEPVVKIVKKSKTPGPENTYSNPSPVQPSQPSPRHLISPNVMPGTGDMNMTNIRSPSEKSRERDSLVISVPLPSISQGLNLSTHQQSTGQSNDHQSPAPHIFHQVQKQAAMEQSSIPSMLSHSMSGQLRWGGLKVSHEMQKVDVNKPGVSGMPSMRDSSSNSAIRNKKRVVTSTHTTTSTIQISSAQPLANKIIPTQATPPPLYAENLNDSSSTSSSSEKQIYPKMENTLDDTLPQMISKSEREVSAHLEGQMNADMAVSPAPSQNVPPPLFNRATQDSANRGPRTSMSSAQGLDQLLERQWEQGSQFLMEQAEHFDIASLLSCLHQLRTDNVRLEEHVNSLLQRRDHLLAVNARLAIPLTAAGPSDPNRSTNESTQIRGPMPYERKQ